MNKYWSAECYYIRNELSRVCHIRGLNLFCTGKCLATVPNSRLFYLCCQLGCWEYELTQGSVPTHLVLKFLHCMQRRPAFSAKVNRPQCNLELKMNSKLWNKEKKSE